MHTYHTPLDDRSMESLGRKKFSSETMKKVQWVRNMYNDWRAYRNASDHLESIECDIEDVAHIPQESLCKAVCKFLTEVKKIDGSDFPVHILYDIVICLQFHLECNGIMWKLISDGVFAELKFTLDNVMKSRHGAGIGNKVKQADVVNLSDEEILWSISLLGTSNPQVLLDTLVYLIGLHCSLGARKEHRSLRSLSFNSQFEF